MLMNEDITISLPSLIRRFGREEVKYAKGIALQYHCELKRIGRSRNWLLSGEPINIASYSSYLKMETKGEYHYLIQKMDTVLLDHKDKLEPLKAKLIRLVTDNPGITLAELMHMTDCTMAEARTARFDADTW